MDFFERASFFSFLAQDFGGSFGSDMALRGIWTRGISVRGVLLVGSGPQTRGKLGHLTRGVWKMSFGILGKMKGSVLDTGPEMEMFTDISLFISFSETVYFLDCHVLDVRLILDPGRVEFW
uniref:Uncharacterized protein n=1 Tax=Rhizophagus irregularis (strain DAOM 181602 / DAOM 197198 / MUCL 43194) TaxID=747089 RepID=U9TEG8_RHIID